jgi:molybdate transport system ATP-binding protein
MNRQTVTICLHNASVRREGRLLLRHITLTVDSNMVVCGPCGAGKTTLLQLLAGAIWPVEPIHGPSPRTYLLNDQATPSPLAVRPFLRFVSPHQASWYQSCARELSVREALAAGAHGTPFLPHPPAALEERIIHTAQRLELTALLHRSVRSLSTGQMARLLLGRALIAEPAMLLLDEWHHGLDRPGRHNILEILEENAAQGLRLIIATHRQDLLPSSLGQRITLDQGSIKPDTPRKPQPLSPSGCSAPLSGPEILALRDVCVARNQRLILDHIHWQGRAGEIWLLGGTNGAGKSTLLQTLAGWLHPLPGGEILRLTPQCTILEAKTHIGIMAPWIRDAMEPSTPVRDALLSGMNGTLGRWQGLAGQIPLHPVARQWGLEDWMDRPVGSLSLGESRLLLLARAMIGDPAVLLLDEPYAGLDATWQQRLQHAIARCATHHRLLVIATHDPHEVSGLATHALVLEDGAIAAQGPWETVRHSPAWQRTFGGDG